MSILLFFVYIYIVFGDPNMKEMIVNLLTSLTPPNLCTCLKTEILFPLSFFVFNDLK